MLEQGGRTHDKVRASASLVIHGVLETQGTNGSGDVQAPSKAIPMTRLSVHPGRETLHVRPATQIAAIVYKGYGLHAQSMCLSCRPTLNSRRTEFRRQGSAAHTSVLLYDRT